jgi:DNA polymerase-3 subunit delta'
MPKPAVPHPNWRLSGHEWAVQMLKAHIAQEAVRHAYLFTGPEGVGRRTLTIRLAQALNCIQPPAPGEPCFTCRACTQIERMLHPDLAVIQAEGAGGVLKVEQVRLLQRSLSLAPYEARYRVALLLRFEDANQSAANALLKTLEEPPPQVVLALTAESAERLMPTIVSRCEVIRLRPISLERLRLDLQEELDLPEEKARLLAHLSGGRPGYALRLQHETDLLARRHAWLDDHARLLIAGRVERFAYAETLIKDKAGLREALNTWMTLWRDALLRATGTSTPLTNLDREAEIDELAGSLGVEVAHRSVKALERTLDYLDRNVNPRLAVEVLMLDLPVLRVEPA